MPWNKRTWFIIKSWIRSVRHYKHIPNTESRLLLKDYYTIYRNTTDSLQC